MLQCVYDQCCTNLLLQVFGDEAYIYKLEDIGIQDFGKVGEVTVTKDDTLLIKVSYDVNATSVGWAKKQPWTITSLNHCKVHLC